MGLVWGWLGVGLGLAWGWFGVGLGLVENRVSRCNYKHLESWIGSSQVQNTPINTPCIFHSGVTYVPQDDKLLFPQKRKPRRAMSRITAIAKENLPHIETIAEEVS